MQNRQNFVLGILIIIFTISLLSTTSLADLQIPTWVKKNANWWGHDQISDEEFVKGLQYLINVGIMKV